MPKSRKTLLSAQTMPPFDTQSLNNCHLRQPEVGGGNAVAHFDDPDVRVLRGIDDLRDIGDFSLVCRQFQLQLGLLDGLGRIGGRRAGGWLAAGPAAQAAIFSSICFRRGESGVFSSSHWPSPTASSCLPSAHFRAMAQSALRTSAARSALGYAVRKSLQRVTFWSDCSGCRSIHKPEFASVAASEAPA